MANEDPGLPMKTLDGVTLATDGVKEGGNVLIDGVSAFFTKLGTALTSAFNASNGLKEGGSVILKKQLISPDERRYIESSPLLVSSAGYDNTSAQSQNGSIAGGDLLRNVSLAGFSVPATRRYYVPSIVVTSTIEGDFNIQIGNGSLQAAGNTAQRTLRVVFGPGGGTATLPYNDYIPERSGLFMVTNTAISGSGVRAVAITNAGTGYTTGTYQLVFTGGGGTGARGTATVTGGIFTAITMIAPGTGYTTAPTITIPTATGGSNASLTASVGGIGFFKCGFSIPSAQNLTNCNVVNRDKAIGFVGDSLIMSTGPTYGSQFMPFMLRDWYISNGAKAGIIVKGNGGYDSINIAEMINTQSMYMGDIDLLLWNIGMNDAVLYSTIPATFQANFATFMASRNTFYRNVPLIICGPTPRQDAYEISGLTPMRTWLLNYVTGLNDVTTRYCNAANGIDRTNNANYTDGTGANGIHLSAAGHAIFVNNLKATLSTSPAITLL